MNTSGTSSRARRAALLVAGIAAGAVPALLNPAPSRVAAASQASVVLADGGAPLGTVQRTLFGADMTTGIGARQQNGRAMWPSVAAASQKLGLQFFRLGPNVNFQYCGGRDCTYHWNNETPGATSSTTAGSPPSGDQLSADEFMAYAADVSSSPTVMPILNMEAGTLAEAQDWVAYMNGSTTDTTMLSDLSTVGKWASLRATNGHPQPYGIRYWEVGNEEWDAHICLKGGTAAGCVDHYPTPDPTDTTCLEAQTYTTVSTAHASAVYACVVKYYARAVHVVDHNAVIVASHIGLDFKLLNTVAGSAVGAFDVHDYDTPIDPYGPTFTLDRQTQSYTLAAPAQSSTTVTFGLWTTSGTSQGGYLQVSFDGTPVTALLQSSASSAATSNFVPGFSAWAQSLPVLTFQEPESTVRAQTPVITVTACDGPSWNATTASCTAGGLDPEIDLHEVTASAGALSAAQLQGSAGCFSATAAESVPTTLEDTRVATTQTATTTQPWRLSSQEDQPVAFTSATRQQLVSLLQNARTTFASDGYGTQPIIVGEYAGWGSCEQEPLDLNLSQTGAIWLAAQTAVLAQDHDSTQPIIGAGYFTWFGEQGAYCLGWMMVNAALSGTSWCAGSDSGYLVPTGWAMSQFAGLTGSYIAAAVSGAPSVTSYPASAQGQSNDTGLVAVASMDTSGTSPRFDVVLVNLCPPVTVQQCGGSGPITVTLSLGSGAAFTSASATTVAATDAYADDTDTAQTTVQALPLTTSLGGGTVTLTLPAFSVTQVALGA